MGKTSLERKGFAWLTPRDHGPSLRWELKQRLCRGGAGWLLMPCSTCFLLAPRTPSQDQYPPQWAGHYLVVPSSQLALACVKLISQQQRRPPLLPGNQGTVQARGLGLQHPRKSRIQWWAKPCAGRRRGRMSSRSSLISQISELQDQWEILSQKNRVEIDRGRHPILISDLHTRVNTSELTIHN